MLRATLVVCCLILLVSTSFAAGTADAEDTVAVRNPSADPGFEVLLEGGLAVPVGNLGAGFRHTATGVGAEQGYRLGLRVRWIRKGGLTLAPNLTFSEFGDHDDRDDVSGKTDAFDGKFTLDTSTVRYGLDIGYLAPGEPDEVRPYVGVGAAVMRNRYKETQVDEDLFYEDTIHSFGWLMTVGARWRELELAFEYHGTGFETVRFFKTSDETSYNWSHFAVRIGYAMPRL